MGRKAYKRRNAYKGVRWYWWLLGAAVWFAVMLVSFRPELQYVRDTFAYKISGKLIYSGIVLYFAWVSRRKPPREGRIIMTLMAATFWQKLIIPSDRFLLLHITVLVFAGAGYLIYLMIVRKKNNEPLMFACMYFGIMLLDFMGDYTYVHDNNAFRHWQISLVFGLAIGVAACYLIYHGIIQLKDDRTSERVCWCIMAAFVGFYLTWATANNLNYMLDTSEPEHFQMYIAEKEIDTSGKTTTYEMTLLLGDDEIGMDVEQSVYFHYEIGEYLPVELYQGFFNDPYYINE